MHSVDLVKKKKLSHHRAVGRSVNLRGQIYYVYYGPLYINQRLFLLFLPKSGRHFELKVGFMWTFLGKQGATVKVRVYFYRILVVYNVPSQVNGMSVNS